MDVKTLSTIIGHVSCSTTLNVYAHVTDEMRRTAAVKIDQGIGRVDPQAEIETAPRKPAPSTFQALKGQRRKAGTGCISQINEKLWEGRYSPIWPDGKKHARNVYAHSEEKCEKLLAEMIAETKMEIAAEKERLKADTKSIPCPLGSWARPCPAYRQWPRSAAILPYSFQTLESFLKSAMIRYALFSPIIIRNGTYETDHARNLHQSKQ